MTSGEESGRLAVEKPWQEPFQSPQAEGSVAVAPWRIVYAGVQLPMAALAMVATLPGRTQGLGMVTEPLLTDLQLDRGTYAQINLLATLLGALFCLPAGWLIDRFGTRRVLAGVALTLGLTVWGLSGVTGVLPLFLLITLTRGLGQSALSVVSIAMVGKWFSKQGPAMSGYSILLSIGFSVAFGVVGHAIVDYGWREAWWGIGAALVCGLAPLALLLVRSTPESCGFEPPGSRRGDGSSSSMEGYRLAEALRTPAFWVFAGATSIYGLTVSGLGLWNQKVLAELGFDANTYYQTLMLSTAASLVGQLACGAAALKVSLRRLMALAMVLYSVSLLVLPHVRTTTALIANVLTMGAAGGMIMVIFFAVWGQTFGRAHLGRIQGAAQMLTVLASAVGPLIFQECFSRSGSYVPVFYGLAPIVILLGLWAWFVPPPARSGSLSNSLN